MCKKKRKTFNRFFQGTTTAIPTNTWSSYVFTPGQDIRIISARVVALWVPLAGGVNVTIPNRFSFGGPVNFPMDNGVDTLPGTAFNSSAVWGITTPAGNKSKFDYVCPAGQSVTIQGRSYCTGAAFALNDEVQYFLEFTYEEI